MDDKTLFETLCQQAQEAGLPGNFARHEVFTALLNKDFGFFDYMFRQDDGRYDDGETALMHEIFILCYGVNDAEIYGRFVAFVES